uniref:AB hydrolase-1 domain-containing protein n=1 Tax=Oryza nivara TaxID=4536 RepID=A0A0E0IUQ7_ORYNI
MVDVTFSNAMLPRERDRVVVHGELDTMAAATEQPQQITEIEHAHLPVRGLSLHVAQAGKGELGTVVFLHGFPEIWYSWRHQMLAVAAAGYRAVAPDWRGYGLSDQPPEPEAAEYDDLIEDLLAILDALAVPKAFLVAKDFGALVAYDFALCHPNRTCGVMGLGIPFGNDASSINTLPEGLYIFRWAQPGRAEADFGRYNIKRVVRTIYILFSKSEIPMAKEDQEIMDLADLSTPLPEWFTEEDLDVYSSLYEKSGFRYPLQMPYRSLHKRKPIGDAKFQVPVFVVMGEKDYVYKFPGVESAMKDGTMERHAPDMKITYIPEGSHFVQEQFPDYVNELLLAFLKDHPVDK